MKPVLFYGTIAVLVALGVYVSAEVALAIFAVTSLLMYHMIRGRDSQIDGITEVADDIKGAVAEVQAREEVMNDKLYTSSYHEFHETMVMRSQCRYWHNVLKRTKGNVEAASKIANVNRTTVYRMIERHKLDINEYRKKTNV